MVWKRSCDSFAAATGWGVGSFLRYHATLSQVERWWVRTERTDLVLFLAQDSSYWAIKLPHGWWVFGLDNALQEDIDTLQVMSVCLSVQVCDADWRGALHTPSSFQYQYFAQLAATMDPDDRVIICTHEPDWVLDAFQHHSSADNLRCWWWVWLSPPTAKRVLTTRVREGDSEQIPGDPCAARPSGPALGR